MRQRYRALLAALAKRFDGEVYGVNLPETAIDLDEKIRPPDLPATAILREKWKTAFARKAFQ